MPESMNLHVTMTGPILWGKAPDIVAALCASAVTEVADYAKFEVLSQLDKVLQNPTGYYESQITDTPVTAYMHRIHDNGVVYGPWLEGISSRNETTRFKGYHTFRIVRSRLAQKTKAIVEAHFSRVREVL